MHLRCLLRLSALVLLGAAALSRPGQSPFVSDASAVLARRPAPHSPESMVRAARDLLSGLDEAQRSRLLLPLDHEERTRWTNLPPDGRARGLRLGDCGPRQLEAAAALLHEVLGESGYRKMVHVLLGDDVLWDREGRVRGGLGVAETRLVLFGTPSASGPWALQLDGHHVGANVAIEGERVELSPYFIGAQPEVFEVDGERLQPMLREVELALALVRGLDPERRSLAVLSDRRGDLVSGPGADGEVPEPAGLEATRLTPAERERLLELVSCWVDDLPPRQAAARMMQLRGEVDGLRLAWWGSLEDGGAFSYRVQGPSLLIEFACVGPAVAPRDHLHSMYRNLANEYGGQLGG
jgi:hypothetical protein